MFFPSTPVSGAELFGRNKEIDDLVLAVEALVAGAPAWIALLGRRKIGKSSILLELARRVSGERLVVVLLDSFEMAPLGPDVLIRYAIRVADAALGRLAGTSLETLALTHPAEYRAALVPVIPRLPDSVARFVLELPAQNPGPGVNRLCLDLAEQLCAALDIHLVVAWDEFQAIGALRARRGLDELLPLIRSVWQYHRRVTYFVSGSQPGLLREMLLEPDAPFYQHFAARELAELAEADSVRLLVDSAPPGRPIPAELALNMVRTLGGHPFYLQLAGDELTRMTPPYDEDSFKAAMQELLFSRAGRLSLFFQHQYSRLVGSATTLAQTLRAIAGCPGPLSEIARLVGAPTSATNRYLSRLGDAVARTDDCWRIADPVFAWWLRWRSPGGAAVPMTVLGNEGERIAAEYLCRLGFELVYRSKASRGSFDLLAIRSAWQVGLQVKRTRTPLRFGREEWHRMAADAARLGWQWAVVAVSPDDDSVVVLDPGRARHGRQVRLGADAAIENVLAWVEERRPGPNGLPRRD